MAIPFSGDVPVDTTLLLQSITDAVIVVDANWHIQQWNSAATQIYGWQPAEVHGRAISAVIPVLRYPGGDTPASARATLLQAATWRGLVVQPHRDGHELTIEASVHAVRTADGALVAAIAINRDVSDRAEAQRVRAAAEAQQRLAFLAEASTLLASSLDYQATLSHLVVLTVPRLADGCLVYLLDDAASVDLALAYHREAHLQEVVNTLARLAPGAFTEQHPLMIVLRTGQAVLLPEVSPAQIAVAAHDATTLHLLQQLNPRSSLFVPLAVRGQTIGALALVITDDTRRFGQADQDLAMELAHRAAQAINNAQLYAASRKTQALLDTLFATAPIGLAFLDQDLRFVQINAALAEIDGLPVAAHLGRSLHDVLPHLAPILEPIYRQVLATREPVVNLELSGETRAAPGSTRSWLASYYPVQLEDSAVLGVGVVVVEITVRREAELTLQRSEALYRAIVRSLPDAAVLVVDPNLRYFLAEGPLLARVGLSREGMEGHTPSEVFDAQSAQTIEGRFRRALAGEDVVAESQYAGQMLWLHYAPLRDQDGQVWAAMALTLDTTARTRLEAQLRQAQKMESIGLLAGGIAHDFNNLLTAIGGYADLALAQLADDAQISADLREIQTATERAAALTRQLLAFARRQHMELRPLDLNLLVANLEKLLRRLIGEHIQLVVEAAFDLGKVVADAGQLEQVIINLAVNARDAMPEGGTLTIGTAMIELEPGSSQGHVDLPAGWYVLLAVGDTGVGIPPEIQPHLFEPFFTTKPVGEGSGLGLATCYGIVKQHGGTIWVYSEVDHGTVVKVFLPCITADAAQPQPSNVTARLPQGNETVLIAEDELAVRSLAVRVLQGCGYTVLEATNGQQALRLAHAHAPEPIHLLLSDVVMPQMGGITLADQIRSLYPALRVLFMSGYTGLSSSLADTAASQVPLLQKPFVPLTLATAVRAALDASL